MSNSPSQYQDKQNLDDFNIISSTLSVKCSGSEMEQQINKDLQLPEGKTIAQLLYDQKENG